MNFKILLFVFALIVIPHVAQCGETTTYSDPYKYWHSFRKAVMDNDKSQVLSLTHFPFKIKGTDDSDGVKKYDKNGFTKILVKLLDQHVLLPGGSDKVIEKTMRQIVQEKKNLVREDFLTPNIIRIEDFVFKSVNGHWLFTQGYLEE
jgi:hypothetical protein